MNPAQIKVGQLGTMADALDEVDRATTAADRLAGIALRAVNSHRAGPEHELGEERRQLLKDVVDTSALLASWLVTLRETLDVIVEDGITRETDDTQEAAE